MLLRLKVKNFLSFYEEVSFDMFPNLKRTTHQNHIYHEGMQVPLLKQAAIYGANGSGKSNLIKAIDFVKSFVVSKEFHKQMRLPVNRFRLKESSEEEYVVFSVEFVHKKIYFLYNIEINENEIKKEELYLSCIGQKENELIFSREKTIFKTAKALDENVKKAITNVLKSNPKSSLMSLNNEFPILDNRVKVAYEWFEEKLKILSLHSVNSALINQFERNEELITFVNNLFSEIDLGVQKIEIEKQLLRDILGDDDESQFMKENITRRIKEDGNVSHVEHDKILFSIENENGEETFKRFLFKQFGINGFVGSLGFESQSDGTAKVLNLLPVVYDLIHNECVYFIDEIENSIHPTLMVALMKYYSKVQTKGQLIYTTHQTELLDQQELMRPDEVWFTEKHDGQTKLYSLNNFKEHNTINIKNGYLDGRYGAIPFIGNLEE